MLILFVDRIVIISIQQQFQFLDRYGQISTHDDSRTTRTLAPKSFFLLLLLLLRYESRIIVVPSRFIDHPNFSPRYHHPSFSFFQSSILPWTRLLLHGLHNGRLILDVPSNSRGRSSLSGLRDQWSLLLRSDTQRFLGSNDPIDDGEEALYPNLVRLFGYTGHVVIRLWGRVMGGAIFDRVILAASIHRAIVRFIGSVINGRPLEEGICRDIC